MTGLLMLRAFLVTLTSFPDNPYGQKQFMECQGVCATLALLRHNFDVLTAQQAVVSLQALFSVFRLILQGSAGDPSADVSTRTRDLPIPTEPLPAGLSLEPVLRPLGHTCFIAAQLFEPWVSRQIVSLLLVASTKEFSTNSSLDSLINPCKSKI